MAHPMTDDDQGRLPPIVTPWLVRAPRPVSPPRAETAREPARAPGCPVCARAA